LPISGLFDIDGPPSAAFPFLKLCSYGCCDWNYYLNSGSLLVFFWGVTETGFDWLVAGESMLTGFDI
jgi:hypothetical protein